MVVWGHVADQENIFLKYLHPAHTGLSSESCQQKMHQNRQATALATKSRNVTPTMALGSHHK
jgi:hypothetical protein